MTEDVPRRGEVRDVPPPRPVPSAPPPGGSTSPAEEGPLARAARVVADAVSGLLGGGQPDTAGAGAPGGSATGDTAGGEAASAARLKDVAAALAGAMAAWRMRRGERPAPGGESAGAPGPAAGSPPGAAENEREDWSPGAFLSDLLATAAPRLPIRDRTRLREAYPRATDDQIADALAGRAARLTSSIGAAAGGVSALAWLAPPSMVALPVGVAVETVLVAAVEVVLVGELHELYGRPAPGTARERAAAYLASWTNQRPYQAGEGPRWATVLGTAGLTALRRRMTRRLGRSLSSLAPFFIGAALGGRSNRRATESLARQLVADLRSGRPRRRP